MPGRSTDIEKLYEPNITGLPDHSKDRKTDQPHEKMRNAQLTKMNDLIYIEKRNEDDIGYTKVTYKKPKSLPKNNGENDTQNEFGVRQRIVILIQSEMPYNIRENKKIIK